MADSWGGRAGNRIPPPRRGVRAGRGWGRPRRWGAPTGRDGRPPRLRRSRGTGTCSSRPAPRRSPPAAERPPLRPPPAAADGGERCPAIAVMRRDAGGAAPRGRSEGPWLYYGSLCAGSGGLRRQPCHPPPPPPPLLGGVLAPGGAGRAVRQAAATVMDRSRGREGRRGAGGKGRGLRALSPPAPPQAAMQPHY